jgi:hypothetical protein
MIELIYIWRFHGEMQEYERSRLEPRSGAAFVPLILPVLTAPACENGEARVTPCCPIHRADVRTFQSR